MNRRRIIVIVLAMLVVAGGVVAYRQVIRTPPTPELPFTDLETALAVDRERGWEVDNPPRREGPYRSLRLGNVMGVTKDGTPPFTARLRWPTRDRNHFAEEVAAVTPLKGYEYMTRMLEVPDGGRTQVILRRRY